MRWLFHIFGLFLIFASPVYAGTVEELVQKGEDCLKWADSGQLQHHDVLRCAAACKRYGLALKDNPSMLNDLSVQRCNDNYARVKAKLTNTNAKTSPSAASLKRPASVASALSEMETAKQYWQSHMDDNAAASDSSRSIKKCHQLCDQGINTIKTKANIGMKYVGRYWQACFSCIAKDTNGNELKPASPDRKGANAVIQKGKIPDVTGVYLKRTRSGFHVVAEGREDWKSQCNETINLAKGQAEFLRTVKPNDRVQFSGITYGSRKTLSNTKAMRCWAQGYTILGSEN